MTEARQNGQKTVIHVFLLKKQEIIKSGTVTFSYFIILTLNLQRVSRTAYPQEMIKWHLEEENRDRMHFEQIGNASKNYISRWSPTL